MISGNTDGLTEKYGDTFGFYVLGNPMLFVSDLALMREINIKQFSKFPLRQRQDGSVTVLGEFTRDFMSTIGGHQWRRIRQSTVPLMSALKIMEVIPSIVKSAESAINEISAEREYETKELAGHYTIRAIMSATFGIDSTDTKAMNVAAHHANSILPDNLSFFAFFIYTLIPERVRLTLGLSVVPRFVETTCYQPN